MPWLTRSLGCLLALTGVHAAEAADKPNIVLVLADDQGWGDVGYNTEYQYQHPSYKYNWTYNPPRTPSLDAFARSPNSILFWRFYAGSGVCSPTRSALLTGRSPERECIDGADGCGQKPAWSCVENMPLSPRTFTVAEAAKKAGYATTHIGKWHLGDFFPKHNPKPNFAYKKWPVSNPGIHGFDEWHSTEASASSSTTNCGCKQEWWESSPGCITGGGAWHNKSYDCTNYWSPTDLSPGHAVNRPECRITTNASLSCVTNLTTKIEGDDSAYIMDVFEDFLTRKTSGSEKKPFLAVLWLHTNHEPHPALPEFYHNYTDVFGDPAGDYLGTLTQMDVQIGRLRQMLKDKGVADNTLLWYTADNGPHSQGRDKGNKYSALPSTNGLRQCKASLYEGGIREPGILEWPAMIKKNVETWHPAYVADYLPTLLELIGVPQENPSWPSDGMSLLPLVKQLASTSPVNDTSRRSAEHPLVFKLGKQAALIDNEWKILENPVTGQCNQEVNSNFNGLGLFNLDLDPTESVDLSKDPAHAALFKNMSQRLAAFKASVLVSRETESECSAPPGPGPSPAGPTPAPGPAPSAGVFIKRVAMDDEAASYNYRDGVCVGEDCSTMDLVEAADAAAVAAAFAASSCLRGGTIGEHTTLSIGACDQSSKWAANTACVAPTIAACALRNVETATIMALSVKIDARGKHTKQELCKDGATVYFGKDDPSKSAFSGKNFFIFDSGNFSTGQIKHAGCPGMCLSASTASTIALQSCAAAGASGWTATTGV